MKPILRFGSPAQKLPHRIQPQVLPGDVIQLEPLNSTHIEDLTLASDDPDTWNWLFDASVYFEYSMHGLIVYLLERQKLGTDVPFAIIHRASGLAVGITRYLHIQPEDRQLEIATWLAGDYRKRGLNYESKYLLLRHAFDDLGFARVQFDIDINNKPSWESIEKLGIKKVGEIPKKYKLPEGGYRTSYIYSVTDDEWTHTIRAQITAELEKYWQEDDRDIPAELVANYQKGIRSRMQDLRDREERLQKLLRQSEMNQETIQK